MLALADPGVPELMAQGQRAYAQGDYQAAKEAFGEVVLADPTNTHAIQFLRAIKLKEAQLAPSNNDAIKTLVIPNVQLKDATFAAALDYLKQQAALKSVKLSIVSQLPQTQMESKITLSLSNVPWIEALRYACTLNNAVYRMDQYAIIIMPAPAAATVAPVPPQ